MRGPPGGGQVGVACGARFVVTSAAMRIPALLLALAIPSSALAAKIHPPKGAGEMGLELALVDDTWAEDGLGVGGHYEIVLVRDAGPGHVMAGGVGLVAFTDDDDRFGCDREEQIIMGAGRMRYVLGVSDVVKPYVGIGLGIYGVSRDVDDCNANVDDDSDLGIGLPITLGIDFAFDSFSLGISFNAHQTSAGDDDEYGDDDEDFNHVGLGLAWRF